MRCTRKRIESQLSAGLAVKIEKLTSKTFVNKILSFLFATNDEEEILTFEVLEPVSSN